MDRNRPAGPGFRGRCVDSQAHGQPWVYDQSCGPIPGGREPQLEVGVPGRCEKQQRLTMTWMELCFSKRYEDVLSPRPSACERTWQHSRFQAARTTSHFKQGRKQQHCPLPNGTQGPPADCHLGSGPLRPGWPCVPSECRCFLPVLGVACGQPGLFGCNDLI